MAGFEGWEFDQRAYENTLREADAPFQSLVNDMVGEMRSGAPKDTGAGAASIHAEFYTSATGLPAAQIGPDAAHEYMVNVELGSEGRPPEPFMRPVAAKRRNL